MPVISLPLSLIPTALGGQRPASEGAPYKPGVLDDAAPTKVAEPKITGLKTRHYNIYDPKTSLLVAVYDPASR
jgi:hypothetical protein